MPSFAVAYDLRDNMRFGVEKFAKTDPTRQQYIDFLRDKLRQVTRQIWYLVPSWQKPGTTDRVIIYTEYTASNSPSVVEEFCNQVMSGTSQVALDCQQHCKIGTSATEWQPAQPSADSKIIFDWIRT